MGLFTKRYIMSQMEYRTSFFTILIVESLILFSKLLYTVVVYNTDMIVDGLKPEAITMFTGTFFIISAVYGALFMFNFTNLQNSVYDGSLDIAITKPISLQFYLTVSTIDLAVPIPKLYCRSYYGIKCMENTSIINRAFHYSRICVLHYTWSCYALQYSFVTTFTVFLVC